jgi:mRNA interferase HicA
MGRCGAPFLWGRHARDLEKHNISVYYLSAMNSKQMKRWLEQQGATFLPGKGSHLKVFLNGKQSTLPTHGTAELGKGIEAAIRRQLGLK